MPITASPLEDRLETHPRTHGSPGTSTEVAEQAARRRTFAVISHPDAGKSTLTEALALHAHAIGEAGAVHGKGNRRGVVSDWMEMERDRGISITSAVLQFAYAGTVINLLDTPGHADFSEDTYRVLAAVDASVMLVDAAKGIEPQTLKLFEVCRARGVPVITVVNKWDRPGLDALAIMDELTTRLDLHPMPLTWPVGVAGDFRGVLDCTTGEFVEFTRTPGGATEATATRWSAVDARATVGRGLRPGRGGVRPAELLGSRLRPRALPVGCRDAGALRLGRAQLRRAPAARHAGRTGAGTERAT